MTVDLKVIMILKLNYDGLSQQILRRHVWLAIYDFVIVDFPRYSPLEGLILGKREASMYLTSQHSRTKRNAYQGIVCECCYHSCNWFELQQYCGSRKKRDTEPDSISASSQNSGKLIDSVLNKWYKNIRIWIVLTMNLFL